MIAISTMSDAVSGGRSGHGLIIFLLIVYVLFNGYPFNGTIFVGIETTLVEAVVSQRLPCHSYVVWVHCIIHIRQ